MDDRYVVAQLSFSLDDGSYIHTDQWYVIDLTTGEPVGNYFMTKEAAAQWVAHFNQVEQGLS